MTNIEFNDLIKLLKDRKEIAQELLDFTKERTFNCTEEDAERFIIYIEKRSVYFTRFDNINSRINKFKISEQDKENTLYKEVESIDVEFKKIIKQIIALDEKNKITANKLLTVIRGQLKGVKNSQKVNSKYINFYSDYENRSYFDTKK